MGLDIDMGTGTYNPNQRLKSTEERQQLQENNLATQVRVKGLIQAFQSGQVSDEQFNAEMMKLGVTANDLDRYQRNYQAQMTENRGTAGENPLISNLIANSTNRQQWQQQAADQLSANIAANPLRQYNLDTDLKRQMAANNQQNLANNVTNQLTALSNARNTNATMINAAMQGGGAGLSNTSFGTTR